MPKILMLSAFFCLFALPLRAEDTAAAEEAAGSLRANFKRVAVEFSSTNVSNAEEYQNSPVSALSADSETVMKGLLDFVLEYNQPNYQWNNSVYLEYGKTTLKPHDKPKSSSENADEILITSDYNRKMWRYQNADVGPFASLAYQTEFTANDDAPRNKTLRAKAGIKLFNGKYVKSLYAAAVGEFDMTYSPEDTKSAYEVGLTFEYPVREGVKFHVNGYFRDYLTYSRYVGTDFKYDLNIDSRMDVKISDHLSLAPVVNYRRAMAREASSAGSNLMIGVSLGYSGSFDL
mgnify:FL=1